MILYGISILIVRMVNPASKDDDDEAEDMNLDDAMSEIKHAFDDDGDKS